MEPTGLKSFSPAQPSGRTGSGRLISTLALIVSVLSMLLAGIEFLEELFQLARCDRLTLDPCTTIALPKLRGIIFRNVDAEP
jgi:hypothetical protein